MNRALRAGERCSSCLVVANALSRLPEHPGISCRGMGVTDPERLRQYTTVGSVIADPGFLSTSRSLEIYSGFPTEREILFGPSTRFVVAGSYVDADGITRVFLRQRRR